MHSPGRTVRRPAQNTVFIAGWEQSTATLPSTALRINHQTSEYKLLQNCLNGSKATECEDNWMGGSNVETAFWHFLCPQTFSTTHKETRVKLTWNNCGFRLVLLLGVHNSRSNANSLQHLVGKLAHLCGCATLTFRTRGTNSRAFHTTRPCMYLQNISTFTIIIIINNVNMYGKNTSDYTQYFLTSVLFTFCTRWILRCLVCIVVSCVVCIVVSCLVCIVVSCLACTVVILCVLYYLYIFVLYMYCCFYFRWLEVSIRKVLRPATSTQVFLGSPVSIKQMLRWFPRLQVATTCFSCSPPDLNLLVTNLIFCVYENSHCHRVTTQLLLIVIIIIIIIIIHHWN